jgi:hypothetical protein
MAKPNSRFFADPLYSRMADDLHLGGTLSIAGSALLGLCRGVAIRAVAIICP